MPDSTSAPQHLACSAVSSIDWSSITIICTSSLCALTPSSVCRIYGPSLRAGINTVISLSVPWESITPCVSIFSRILQGRHGNNINEHQHTAPNTDKYNTNSTIILTCSRFYKPTSIPDIRLFVNQCHRYIGKFLGYFIFFVCPFWCGFSYHRACRSWPSQ